MSYVAERAKKHGDLAIQIDLRSIGSNSYIYVDQTAPAAERATTLLRDFISSIHDALLEQVTSSGSSYNAQRLTPLIEAIGQSVKEVFVRETIERKRSSDTSDEEAASVKLTGSLSHLPSVGGEAGGSLKATHGSSANITETGHARLSVNIGHVSRRLNEFASGCGARTWILLDEWSSLPEDLQPYVADFVRRVFFPNTRFTLHIAAIERRSVFRIVEGSWSIGLELGSDASADINLDDFLVFENNPERSILFFQEMLFRHLKSVALPGKLSFDSASELIGECFTQLPTFREFVRASEGVPRDAINILQLAALKAGTGKISVPHVRAAAKDWYDRDKSAYLQSNAEADDLLQWIVGIVIGQRKAKAFLLAANARNELLERLFDERILHIAKRFYSAKHDPSTRYRIWKIDYGCYVDKINTSQSPIGYLSNHDENEDGAVVPEDDFRAIRHAVLDLDDYAAFTKLFGDDVSVPGTEE